MKRNVVMEHEVVGVPMNLPNGTIVRIARKLYERYTRPHKWEKIGDKRVQKDWTDFVADVHKEVFKEYKRNGR